MFNNNNRSNNFQQQKSEFDFCKKGYFTDGIIRGELLTSEAESVAQNFQNERLTASQMRAFFNEVKALSNRLKDDGSNFASVYPLILMMKSKAEYRCGSKKIPNYFRDFISMNIDSIQGYHKKGEGKMAFDAFELFFEAVVGYSSSKLR